MSSSNDVLDSFLRDVPRKVRFPHVYVKLWEILAGRRRERSKGRGASVSE